MNINKSCLESRAYYIDFNLSVSGQVEIDGIVDKYGVCDMTARRDIQMYKARNKDVSGSNNLITRDDGFKSLYGNKITK